MTDEPLILQYDDDELQNLLKNADKSPIRMYRDESGQQPVMRIFSSGPKDDPDARRKAWVEARDNNAMTTEIAGYQIGSFVLGNDDDDTDCYIDILCNDTLIAEGEVKRFGFKLRTNNGRDMTYKVAEWYITRQTTDPASDAVWNVSEKASNFSNQTRVSEAVIYIQWTNDESNDLDDDPSQNVTYFTVTAVMGSDEYQAVIEY